MIKQVAVAALAMTIAASTANALTFKKGQVLSSDGQVVNADQTASGKRQIEMNGFVIGGGVLYLGDGISIPLIDLQGKSKAEIVVIVSKALGVSDEVANAAGAAVAASVAEKAAENVANEVADSVAESVAESVAATVAETVAVEVAETVAEEVSSGPPSVSGPGSSGSITVEGNE